MTFIHMKFSSFLVLEFYRIFYFPCVVSRFFLLTIHGKLLTAHIIGTPEFIHINYNHSFGSYSVIMDVILEYIKLQGFGSSFCSNFF